MSAVQGKHSIGKDWLVDSSALLKDGMTRVIFYNPHDELHCEDALFDLESMTVEEIAVELNTSPPELSYGQVCAFAEWAKLGLLHSWVGL